MDVKKKKKKAFRRKQNNIYNLIVPTECNSTIASETGFSEHLKALVVVQPSLM